MDQKTLQYLISARFDAHGAKEFVKWAEKMQKAGHMLEQQQKKTNTASAGLGKGIARLAGRALITIPIWMALRGIFTALTGAIKDGIKEWVELEKEMGRVSTVTRGTEAQLNSLRDAIITFGAGSSRSFKETATAMYALGSAGLNVKEQLTGFNHIMNLAVGTFGNVEQAAKLVAGSYNVFGNSLDGAITSSAKMQHISDMLAYTYSTQQVELSEIANAMTYVASIGSLVNVSFDTLVTTIGTLNTGMLKGTKSGTALMNALIRVAQKGDKLADLGVVFDPSKPLDFVDIVTQLSEKYGDTALSLTSLKEIMDTFGRRGGRAIAQLIADFDRWKKDMDDAKANFQDFAEIMREKAENTLPMAFKKLGNAIKGSVIEAIGRLEGVRDVVAEIGEAMQQRLFYKQYEDFLEPPKTAKAGGSALTVEGAADITGNPLLEFVVRIDAVNKALFEMEAYIKQATGAHEQEIAAIKEVASWIIGIMSLGGAGPSTQFAAGPLQAAGLGKDTTSEFALATQAMMEQWMANNPEMIKSWGENTSEIRSNTTKLIDVASSLNILPQHLADSLKTALGKEGFDTTGQSKEEVLYNKGLAAADAAAGPGITSKEQYELNQAGEYYITLLKNQIEAEEEKSRIKRGLVSAEKYLEQLAQDRLDTDITEEQIKAKILKNVQMTMVGFKKTKAEMQAMADLAYEELKVKEKILQSENRLSTTQAKAIRLQDEAHNLAMMQAAGLDADVVRRQNILQLLASINTEIEKANTKNLEGITDEEERASIKLEQLTIQQLINGEYDAAYQAIIKVAGVEKDIMKARKEALELQVDYMKEVEGHAEKIKGTLSGTLTDFFTGDIGVEDIGTKLAEGFHQAMAEGMADSLAEGMMDLTGADTGFGQVMANLRGTIGGVAGKVKNGADYLGVKAYDSIVKGADYFASKATAAVGSGGGGAKSIATAGDRRGQTAGGGGGGLLGGLVSGFKDLFGGGRGGTDGANLRGLGGLSNQSWYGVSGQAPTSPLDVGTYASNTGSPSWFYSGTPQQDPRTGGGAINFGASVNKNTKGSWGKAGAVMGGIAQGAMAGYSQYQAAGGSAGGGMAIASGALTGIGSMLMMVPSGVTQVIGGAMMLGGMIMGAMNEPEAPMERREEVKESTRQISSRIDITNSNLEWVNRNLVALRQELTYIMQESFYFGEQSEAERFALGSQRGITGG